MTARSSAEYVGKASENIFLLKGLDHQLIVNLKAEREDMGQYAGLKVGDIDNPNNNAGNWE